MPNYPLSEARLLQQVLATSAADGLSIYVGPVPANTFWTILSAFQSPSVAETQIVWFSVLSRGSIQFPITRPVSYTAAPAVNQTFPLLTEGLEISLFPGERLYAFRAAATAGSTLSIYARFIKSDLPYYDYQEPLKPVLRKSFRSTARGFAGSGVGGGGGGPLGEPGGGPGGGGEPVL